MAFGTKDKQARRGGFIRITLHLTPQMGDSGESKISVGDERIAKGHLDRQKVGLGSNLVLIKNLKLICKGVGVLICAKRVRECRVVGPGGGKKTRGKTSWCEK